MSDDPVSAEKQIRFEFQYAPDYKVYAANGAWGGVTTRGDIKLDFFVESPKNPEAVLNTVLPDGTLTEEQRLGLPERTHTRLIQCGVLMSIEQAESLADFIKQKTAIVKTEIEKRSESQTSKERKNQ